MYPYAIINRDKLLGDIADGIEKLTAQNYRLPCDCLTIHFHMEGDETTYEFGLQQALAVLAEDLYFDDRGNWSQAVKATVEVM